MYYILLNNGTAAGIIPENDPIFPGVPITARYAPDFLARCVMSETQVPSGWPYEAETGTFSEPPPPPEPEPIPEEEPVPDTPTGPTFDERVTALEDNIDALLTGLEGVLNA